MIPKELMIRTRPITLVTGINIGSLKKELIEGAQK
jgi:hypothetical protein